MLSIKEGFEQSGRTQHSGHEFVTQLEVTIFSKDNLSFVCGFWEFCRQHKTSVPVAGHPLQSAGGAAGGGGEDGRGGGGAGEAAAEAAAAGGGAAALHRSRG